MTKLLDSSPVRGVLSALAPFLAGIRRGVKSQTKPMNSGGSSSFWFQVEEMPGRLTEIDVFEIGGIAEGYERKYNMNVDLFHTPTKKEHWTVGGVWIAPWRLADDYHVQGLEWTLDEIKYYVDGVLVRSVENTHWHQWHSIRFICYF